MQSYIIFFIVIIFFASINRRIALVGGKNNIYLYPILISFLVYAVLLGFRGLIGIDDTMYLRTFNEVARTGKVTRNIEISYILLCKLVQSFGGGYQWIVLTYAILSCVLLYRAVVYLIPQEGQAIFLGIFVAYFFPDFLTAMRQFLAIAILLNAYIFAKEKKNISAIMFYALAVFVQKTAAVGLVYYILVDYVKRISLNVKIVMIIVCYIIQYIPFVDEFLAIFEKIPIISNSYYGRFFLTAGATNLFSDPLGIIASLMLIGFVVIMVWNSKNEFFTCDESYQEAESMAFLYWTSLMLMNQLGYIRRISYYVGFFMTAYFVYSSSVVTTNSKKMFRLFILLASFVLFFYSVSNYGFRDATKSNLVPYMMTFEYF